VAGCYVFVVDNRFITEKLILQVPCGIEPQIIFPYISLNIYHIEKCVLYAMFTLRKFIKFAEFRYIM
jgi:hypothetical protein